MSGARPGDPAILYTDPAKIKYELGWTPKFPDIESIVRHGWEWRVHNYGNPPAPSVDPLMHNYISFTPENDTAPALKVCAASWAQGGRRRRALRSKRVGRLPPPTAIGTAPPPTAIGTAPPPLP